MSQPLYQRTCKNVGEAGNWHWANTALSTASLHHMDTRTHAHTHACTDRHTHTCALDTCTHPYVHSALTHVGELLMRKSCVILADVSRASTTSTFSLISLSNSRDSLLTSNGVLSSNWRQVYGKGRGGEGRGWRSEKRRMGLGEKDGVGREGGWGGERRGMEGRREGWGEKRRE